MSGRLGATVSACDHCFGQRMDSGGMDRSQPESLPGAGPYGFTGTAGGARESDKV